MIRQELFDITQSAFLWASGYFHQKDSTSMRLLAAIDSKTAKLIY
jgi:hypothetical protein